MRNQLEIQRAHAQIKIKFLDNDDEFFTITSEQNDDDDEEDSGYSNDDEIFFYIGTMKLDTLVWPTITGSLDFEEISDKYYAFVRLKIPDGEIEIRNHLVYPVSQITLRI